MNPFDEKKPELRDQEADAARRLLGHRRLHAELLLLLRH